MSGNYFRPIVLAGIVILLAGCQVSLHTGLTEGEANQMLALLLLNNITAKKEPSGSMGVNLSVAKLDFVRAVEILRQQGYPKRKFESVTNVFPSGQLVTSPNQEQAKITYLKEQRIEEMLTQLEGILSVKVIIAEAPANQTRRELSVNSVAVFIKHSPANQFSEMIPQIKSLIHNSIAGLSYDTISVVLQPTDYRIAGSGLK